MKFLVDAQLPKKLSNWLIEQGYDSVHTLDLLDKNLTTDSFINTLSVKEKRIVISKDSDFYTSYIVKSQPYKLLLISTGNIKNNDLIKIIQDNSKQLIFHLEHNFVVELSHELITVHF